MKRTPLLILAALAAYLTLAAAPSIASAATCSTHILKSTGWSIQSDSFYGSWDFQCGGAENLRWDIVYDLQRKDQFGVWGTIRCDNGDWCEATRPADGTLFGQGSEHSGIFTFNPQLQLDCKSWRVKGQAHFEDGSQSPAFFSAVYDIGGC